MRIVKISRENRRLYHLAVTMAVCLCACVSLQAQSLKRQGMSVVDILPSGWEHQEVTGDLNKDGIPDLVVVATPNFKEHMLTYLFDASKTNGIMK